MGDTQRVRPAESASRLGPVHHAPQPGRWANLPRGVPVQAAAITCGESCFIHNRAATRPRKIPFTGKIRALPKIFGRTRGGGTSASPFQRGHPDNL